jgi:hypothetical protein
VVESNVHSNLKLEEIAFYVTWVYLLLRHFIVSTMKRQEMVAR